MIAKELSNALMQKSAEEYENKEYRFRTVKGAHPSASLGARKSAQEIEKKEVHTCVSGEVGWKGQGLLKPARIARAGIEKSQSMLVQKWMNVNS
jgi:hypothetical protein